MWVDEYTWHYDYARLAWDTGFCFEKFKYPNLDKNKICLIDIDRIIKERDVACVDRNISTVVQYVLDNDQAEVLDTNFVKLFRLGQLSVDYLLFCKKYLDRTVVLLKKELFKLKEETKQLKLYTEELETHLASSRNPVVTFNCDHCSKVFSSEEYLNSHLKRRHNNDENKISSNLEAEKLHTEIKELKERLNNTEKFIQEKPSSAKVDNVKSDITEDKDDDKTKKLVSEIQYSFEHFRKQVEEKMTSLQSEKNFFTDKYDKLFEIVLQYKNKDSEIQKVGVEKQKIECTTQTNDIEAKKNCSKNLQVYTVQFDTCENTNKSETIKKVSVQDENIDEKINKTLTNFEENIETKISNGLCNIENQIQGFWKQLSEVELTKTINIRNVGGYDEKILLDSNSKTISPQNKPKIKPRTKLTKPTAISSRDLKKETHSAQRVKTELEQVLKKSDNLPESKFKPNLESETELNSFSTATKKMYDTSSDDITESENFLDEKEPTLKESSSLEDRPNTNIFTVKEYKEPKVTGRNVVNIKKKSISHNTKDIEKLKQKIRSQFNGLVDASLQEIGISPRWKGIPKKTFEKAMEILNHQAALNQKTHPEYGTLKKSIEKSLKNNKIGKKGKRKSHKAVIVNSSIPNQPKQNVIKFQIRKHHLPETKTDPPLKINRSLYDTESEIDIKNYLPSKFDQAKAHTAVIEELQYKFSQKSTNLDLDKKDNTDSDLNSLILPNDIDDIDKKNIEMKSALKNYTSEGGLVKKKVFFDVVENKEDKLDDAMKTESIDDDSKEKVPQREYGESSFSDFEIT